jgi:hypothetical protein
MPANQLRREWAWALVASLLVVALASLPYVIGGLVQTASARYAWVAVAPEDNLSYFAKIGQGQRGSWLFQLPYSAHTNVGAPINLYYLLLGHLAGALGLSTPLIFHLARLVNGVAVLLVAYAFICLLTERVDARRLLFALAALSSGLGWLMLPLGRLLSTDLSVPESNTFFSLMDAAHFPLSQALMLALGLLVCAPPAATRRGQGAFSLAAALALALQALVQPFVIAVLGGAAAVYAAALWRRDRRPPWFLALRLGPGLLLAGALVLVTNLAVIRDPILNGWLIQNIATSPPVWDYLTGYGLILIPAAFGAVWAARRGRNADLWVLAWVLVTIIGLYAPTTLQRRLSQGLHLPLAFLAGLGVYEVWLRRLARRGRWLVTRLVLLVTVPTTLVLVALFASGAVAHNPKLFLLDGEAQALDYLRAQVAPDGVVLSTPGLGAFIPAFTSERAVSGHGMETVDAAGTEAQVRAFYAADASATARCAALAAWGVDYVLVGPRERALGVSALTPADGVVLLATFDQVAVYAVRLP